MSQPDGSEREPDDVMAPVPAIRHRDRADDRPPHALDEDELAARARRRIEGELRRAAVEH